MTAFVIEALLLLSAAFALGLVLGFRFGRMRSQDAPRGAGAPARAPSPPLPAPAPVAAVPPPRAAEAAAAPPPVTVPSPAEVRQADLFARLGIADGMVSLSLEPDDEPPLPPLPPARPAFAPSPPAALPRAKGPDGHPGARPPTLAAPEGEGPDDLKLLKGIGPQNEQRLNALGIFHFRQIAAWTPDEVAWVGSYLAFPGRIEREDWIGQAKAILEGGAPPQEPGGRRRR